MSLLITGARIIDATGERTGDIRITDGSIGDVGDGQMGSWGYPEGGMGAVSDAIARAARSFGVEIRTKTLIRANGDQLIFDPDSGLFGVAREDGAPRTVFKPADGEAYWATQVKANATAATAARRAASTGG